MSKIKVAQLDECQNSPFVPPKKNRKEPRIMSTSSATAEIEDGPNCHEYLIFFQKFLNIDRQNDRLTTPHLKTSPVV